MLDCTNIFSLNDYEKKNKIVVKSFQQLKRWKKYIVLFVASIENLKKPKRSYLLEKTLSLSIICSNCNNKEERLFKEDESIEILKFLV